MAQRRMFSPQIVESEEFLTMPTTSQALYFHLGMNADDDGFIQPKITMRTTGANDDDLKVLLSKRFLLAFDGGVVVIKHWLIHNLIQKDRYHPTRFIEQKNSLLIKENKAYTEINGSVNKMLTEVRLGKDRLGKVILQAEPADNINPLIKEFEELNPTIKYNNTTQRKACTELIAKFGYEKTIATLNYYKSIRSQKFSPVITTPYQLQQKMGELLTFYNKEQSKSKITIL